MSARSIQSLLNGVNAMNVLSFVADATSPQLMSFNVSLESGELELMFSETVNPSAILLVELFLLSDSNESFVKLFSPQTGVVSLPGPTLTIALAEGDLNRIKNSLSLFTSIEDSFVSLSSSFISDKAGNPIQNVSRMQAASFIEDRIPPILDSYKFDASG